MKSQITSIGRPTEGHGFRLIAQPVINSPLLQCTDGLSPVYFYAGMVDRICGVVGVVRSARRLVENELTLTW
jgi:hypothetical protein